MGLECNLRGFNGEAYKIPKLYILCAKNGDLNGFKSI